ncbi:MAG TPA: M20/M25/M40 family metallo-hydrolase [Thermoanaerobaculia bacterium]|nr:M20/M25/M40 family metallo-hydrolase [Thermoanaerobaculia bacterium]
MLRTPTRLRAPLRWAQLSILAVLLPLSGAAASELDEPERRIVGAVEAEISRALALLERTVDVNSGTMNFAGVREVGRMFAAELEELGFETRWVEGEAFQRAGHLVAERSANGPRVLLIGHLDTVFEPQSPFQRYERISADAAKGPGTTDMKGGNVVMVHALRALRAAGALDALDLRIVLTGDEEKSGRPLSLARQALRDAAQGASAALGFEDGDGDPRTAVISRRGSTDWMVTATGTPAHSSQIFQPAYGAGAVFELARILHGFYQELGSEELLTFNPGLVLGGTTVELDREQARGEAFGKNNVIAERAVATGDLRAISPEQLERARAAMREIVARHLPGTTAEIELGDGYPPMAPSEGNRELLAMLDEISRALGAGEVRAVDPRNAGAADVSFVADLVPRAIDGLGLMGSGGHTVEETADLRTLPTQTQRAALLLHRIAQRFD